jgi:hypothetical protein
MVMVMVMVIMTVVMMVVMTVIMMVVMMVIMTVIVMMVMMVVIMIVTVTGSTHIAAHKRLSLDRLRYPVEQHLYQQRMEPEIPCQLYVYLFMRCGEFSRHLLNSFY